MSSAFLGERVREARKLLKLSTSELGERIGLSQSGVSNIENGKRQPNPPVIAAICNVLGVREEWLRTGEEPMYEEESAINDGEVAYKYLEEALGQYQSFIESADYDALYILAKKRLAEMRKEIGQKARAIVKAAKVVTVPGAVATGSSERGNVINIAGSRTRDVIGGNQTIITERHTTRVDNLPPAGSISEAQARELHRLLVKVGELESMRIGPSGYGSVMNQFKNRYGITSYKNLAGTAYDDAALYLNRRAKTLEKVLLKDGRNPVTKADFIRRIQTICRRELKWNDPIRREKMMGRYGKPSLTQLSMGEIEDFYKYVSGLKGKSK